MGRWSWGWKTTVEDVRSIDINWLMKQRDNKKTPYSYGNSITWTSKYWDGTESKNSISYDLNRSSIPEHIHLRYQVWKPGETDNKQNMSYNVDLTKTPCHIGGFRYWFYCLNCGRRVGKLYLLNKYFLCRHCHNLTYESRNANKRFRFLDVIFRMEKKEDEGWNKLKRKTYAGKPTKKHLKLLYAHMRTESHYRSEHVKKWLSLV